MLCLSNGIQYSNENEWAMMTHKNMSESHKHKWSEKSHTQENISGFCVYKV